MSFPGNPLELVRLFFEESLPHDVYIVEGDEFPMADVLCEVFPRLLFAVADELELVGAFYADLAQISATWLKYMRGPQGSAHAWMYQAMERTCLVAGLGLRDEPPDDHWNARRFALEFGRFLPDAWDDQIVRNQVSDFLRHNVGKLSKAI